MLELNSVLDKEYPKETVLKCKGSYNNIVRTQRRSGMLRAERYQPTLLEMENPPLFEFHDIFEVNEFRYSAENREGHLKAAISLLEESEDLEIKAQILDVKAQKVVAEIKPVEKDKGKTLTLEQGFKVDEKRAESLAVVAYGKWHTDNQPEMELNVYKEIDMDYPGATYSHKYPKKEDSPVQLGKLEERFAPDPAAKGDKECIVIALIRQPKDQTDIDYICGFGRGYHPILAVPGEGTFSFPSGEEVLINDSHTSADCMLYPVSGGGAAYIARSEMQRGDRDRQAAIKFEKVGNGCKYSFQSWCEPYDGSAQWEKTKFNYCLKIHIRTSDGSGRTIDRTFCIDSTNEDSLTDEIRPLQIMYGCMAPDTEIMMSDGKTKQICQIDIGDIVQGRNGENMRVGNIWTGPEPDKMVRISVEGVPTPVMLTKSHPVWVENKDEEAAWKRAGVCRKGDRVVICDAEGKESYGVITDIEEVEPCDVVYNLDLHPCNEQSKSQGTMYCNGILTGDNQIQNSKLE